MTPGTGLRIDRRTFGAGLGAAALTLAMPARAAGQSDIALLRTAYRALHPGLHRYLTPSQADVQFAALDAAWRGQSDLAKRYLSLSRMLATLKCGHSYANFFNQSDAVAAALWTGATRLPFHFRWIGDRMIVIRDPGNTGLKPGTEIVSIDGVASRDTLAALMPFARADGGNDAKRRHLLGVSGAEKIESFDVYHALAFPPARSDVTLAIVQPDGRKSEVTLARIDLAARKAQMANAEAAPDAPAWTIDHCPDGVAVLTMPGWALYDSKWDWKAFLDKSFEDMARRNTRALIVDLRDNEGGLDCGHGIVARLIDTPLVLDAYQRRVRYRSVPAPLRPSLDTWDKSFFDWGDDAVAIDADWFRLRGEDGDAPPTIQPKGPRFRGKLIVLTDAGNSSATFQFAATVQRQRLGTLIGGTTGGNQRGINGGAFFFLRLPESGLEVDVPLIGTFPPAPRPDAGITPEILAENSPADIAAGRDAVIDRALQAARA